MYSVLFPVFCYLGSYFSLVTGECEKECDLPINLYEQLKCTPKFEHSGDCCPKEYDCSNIFKRPEGTCHLRGKFYKPNETLSSDDVAENCHSNCVCRENLEFQCYPFNKGCTEYYLSDYPKEGCYLQYPLDSCCASGEVCPPFEHVATCNVNGTIYKEGQRFPHPLKKCTKCVCSKDFDGTFTAPDCQRKNCTTEIQYSKEIDNYCAPYYISGTCCPAWWICPAEGGEYITATKTNKLGSQCRFGDKMMDVGSKYLYQDEHTAKIICECVVPPFLTCFEQVGE